ncbi:MAG: DNA polymerase IV [bacterium]
MIFHVDMDAFYVSVERLRRPELRGVPVVIGGAPESRGVVASASYEARRFGVHSAQPMSRALRICPGAVRVPADMAAYAAKSREVDRVLRRFTPAVQKVSVDEAYMDMRGTQRLWGPPPEAAGSLQGAVLEEAGLPCSVGGGSNKLIAKVASGLAKPQGVLLVPEGQEAAFLGPLQVGRIPGVGDVARRALEDMGVRTIEQLRGVPEEELVRRFGTHGAELAARARGGGSTRFPGRELPKSVSRETTFERDVGDPGILRGVLTRLLDRAAFALREEGLLAGGVTVKIRYGDFSTTTHGETLPSPSRVDTDFMPVVHRLFERMWARRDEPVRLVGVKLDRLSTGGQMGLFDDRSRRWEQALERVDSVRDRHGFGSVRWGRELAGEAGRSAQGDGLDREAPRRMREEGEESDGEE